MKILGSNRGDVIAGDGCQGSLGRKEEEEKWFVSNEKSVRTTRTKNRKLREGREEKKVTTRPLFYSYGYETARCSERSTHIGTVCHTNVKKVIDSEIETVSRLGYEPFLSWRNRYMTEQFLRILEINSCNNR